jgi:hypothetical protein
VLRPAGVDGRWIGHGVLLDGSGCASSLGRGADPNQGLSIHPWREPAAPATVVPFAVPAQGGIGGPWLKGGSVLYE